MFWVHVQHCLTWGTFHVLWTRLHGVTSQTVIFMATSVRSSNPIHFYISIPEQSSPMDQNPFVVACCPSHTKRYHAFYGIVRFIIVMQFYYVTSLKRTWAQRKRVFDGKILQSQDSGTLGIQTSRTYLKRDLP